MTGAAEPSVSAKKVKTTPEKAAAVKPAELKSALKKAPTEKKAKAAPVPTTRTTRSTKSRAEDQQEPEKPAKAVAAPVKAAVKTKKVVETAPVEAPVKESAAAKLSKGKGKKTAEAPKKVEEETTVAVVENEDDEDDEDEVDDQTAALLAGFESSEDENDPEDDDNEGVPLDKLPSVPDEKNVRKQLKAAEEKNNENKPGVLYVGYVKHLISYTASLFLTFYRRIPHGFFEHQMKAYFSQFGEITHLRLSRNKVTGRSKHYAFIEFASAAVADIVAKTMDKYLLFGHILQVRRIPQEQVHAQLWKGEGRRFKVMPRNKIEGGQLAKGKTREVWEKKVQKETKKREKQAAKLKEQGYEFDMPELRSVDDVATKELIEGEGAAILDAGEVKAILEKVPEAKVEVVQTEETPEEVKVTAKVTAGTKRAKAKGDGKNAKKAKVAA